MKKILLFIFTCLLIFSGCSLKNNYLINIDYSELVNKIDGHESFFIEIMQDGCSHCASFTPIFTEVLTEYKVTGYKLNITNLSQKDYENFINRFGDLGTPTVMFFTNGSESVIQRLVGEHTKEEIIEKLTIRGYIK